MGAIRVRVYGALNLIPAIKADKSLLKRGLLLPITEPTSGRSVLEHFEIPLKDVHIVSIGKERVALDAVLKDGDTLHLFPMTAGG